MIIRIILIKAYYSKRQEEGGWVSDEVTSTRSHLLQA